VPATYVTAATLKASLGVGTLYDSYTWIEDTCQTAQDLLNGFLWFDSVPVVATRLDSNVAKVYLSTPHDFAVGQSVTIAASGSTYNGAKTITGVGTEYITFAQTAANLPLIRVAPFGSCTAADTKTATYAATPAVNAAALILAQAIWQARFTPGTGGVSVDGYTPSPFRMSNTLIASIRGLIANYLAPNAMVG
jgi:hypothetical protein